MQFNPEPGRRVVVMETCSNMRKLGRTGLEGNWLKASLACFIFYLFIDVPVFIINYFFGNEVTVDMSKMMDLGPQYKDLVYTVTVSPMSNVYTILIIGPLTIGLSLFFLNLFRNRECNFVDLFKGSDSFVSSMGLFLYMLLFVVLWSIIPLAGIVLGPMAALRYSQAFLIKLDHPEYPIPVCVNTSKYMMFGNKAKLLILLLSFIGWFLLAVLVSGFAGTGVGFAFYGTDFLNDPTIALGAVETFVVELISSAIISPVLAYVTMTEIAFYEILTGKIKAEVYYPGEY